ncbi:divalent-cation tolerance protein CutA [Dongshaea marina]|uniref:divalent-cation tolerance protein CutA n=1 Tax=Dongshaea marina TaxID=2047966 RepID=UPI000D3EA279|nr:divalent-cation tolerance protein CutA [Dongshaea marina]
MSQTIILIHCSCKDVQEAQTIASALIEQRLAGCATISSPVLSVYRWQQQVESEPEVLLQIKSTQQNFARVEAAILSLHSYDVPEIIATEISACSKDYREWLIQSCQPEPE